MTQQKPLPVFGFAAWSGSGKTTLLKKLLPVLRSSGLRIGMIKHAHHAFEIDQPGKDSFELRKAGADQLLVASASLTALIMEKQQPSEPVLADVISQLNHDSLDLILVEGFRHETFPKIEIHRPSLARPLLYPDDSSILAVATDAPIAVNSIRCLDLNHIDEIAAFILEQL